MATYDDINKSVKFFPGSAKIVLTELGSLCPTHQFTRHSAGQRL